VPRLAPRYPQRLFDLIEELERDDLSLAEVVRRVGAAAQAEGITRPSPAHVRRLVTELREIRRDEQAIRDALLDAAGRVATGRVADPHTLHVPVVRALEQAEVRARRRRT
jgi:hypothetical protein